jgi:tetratricopeptide (TPR) repeat protein
MEATLGQHHPETLSSLDNLAGLLQAMGKHKEAEPVLRRANERRETSLGPNHRDTFASMDSLAALLPQVGKHEEAEHLYRRSLAGKEAVLGPNHRDTLTALDNLAGLLHSMGRHEEAEPLHWDALEGRVVMWGPNHADTLASLNDLAALLAAMNKCDMAEPLYRRALEGKELTLGATHPETLAALDNLAALLQASGKPKEAEPFLQRAFEGRVATVGPGHPDTASSLESLIKLQKAVGLDVSTAPPRGNKSVRAPSRASGAPAGPVPVPAAAAGATGAAATALRVDLSQPLGILFETDLTVKEVEDASQAGRLGVAKGWRVTALGGKALKSMTELESTIKSLKEWGVMQVNATFVPAGSPARATDPASPHLEVQVASPQLRPATRLFGAGVGAGTGASSSGAGGVGVGAQKLAGREAGVQPGGGSSSLPQPVSNGDVREDGGGQHGSGTALEFDLSQPLGILFDDDLHTKVVQGGSQAERMGVCKGWKVMSVDGERLRTPREMEAHMNVLKALGKRKARIFLAAERRDRYLDDNYSKVSEDSTEGSNDGPLHWETQGELGYQRRQLPQERYQELLQCTQQLYAVVRDAPSESENSAESSEASDAGDLPPSRVSRPIRPLFDLSKPLGVLFGNRLAVRDVKAGSQAEHLGIRKGLRASAVNGEAVHRLKALEAKILVLKTKGTTKVTIHFVPVTSSERAAPRDTIIGR